MPVLIEWLLWPLFLLAWLGLGAAAAAHAIMWKREPRSSVLWSLMSFLLPLIGPLSYWGMGINRVERLAFRRLPRREHPLHTSGLAESAEELPIDPARISHLEPLRRIADRVTRLPLLPGNRVAPLHNGEQAYPRMLAAINEARETITLSSYIFDWDDVGHAFVDALDAAARRGVRVHALLDGIGAQRAFSRMGRRMLRSGAETAVFFPLRFPFGRVRLNLRNHRKILVVDGRLGFTGGMNISERHLVENSNPGRVEDLQFEMTGPVVAELQHVFIEDWARATGRVLEGETYFPRLAEIGPALCRALAGGPDREVEIIHWITKAALLAAQHSAWVVTPYLIPTASLISAMVMAKLRGVDVKILLPSVVDWQFMRWAADAYLWQLLEYGIEVYRQPPPFAHTKLTMVDERWIMFGSANMDPRSFRLNFELNIESYDPGLAHYFCEWLQRRLATCSQVTLEEMDSRTKWERLRDGTAKMFSPYL